MNWNANRRDRDLVLDRDDNGDIHASVPYLVRHYGVESFDWGYIGPGTAELALNILHGMLPPGCDGEPPVQCADGICSALAWRIHRSFMAEFLVRMPYAGGCLAEADMRRWIMQHCLDGEHAEGNRQPYGWPLGSATAE